MKSYTLKANGDRWRIVHLEGGWFLQRRVVVNAASRTTVMAPVAVFADASKAAIAVADGTTGELDWDRAPRKLARSAYLLPAWKVGPPFDPRTSS